MLGIDTSLLIEPSENKFTPIKSQIAFSIHKNKTKGQKLTKEGVQQAKKLPPAHSEHVSGPYLPLLLYLLQLVNVL